MSVADSPLVRFSSVRKSYDGATLAVRDLDLDIRRGEFLTLLGPSGSGKTTTLMMLAGFETPSGGEILFDGKPITRTPPHRRNFGMVFQNYALFPHLTVGDNIGYPLTARRVPAPERASRVNSALEMVRLGGMAARRPDQLSGGQRQRVALARALVFEPAIVLMDEPLGALDKQLREHMQVELKDLHRRLGVTHDQSEALALSDRVAVFHDGALQQVDTAERLYEEPANRFVAGFVGDNTALEGHIAAMRPEFVEVTLDCHATLRGRLVGSAVPGTPVQVAIRPERITLRAHAGPNTIGATVEDIVYLGDHVRVRCTIDQATTAVVKRPIAAGPPPAIGARTHLEFPAEHLRIYP